MIALLQLVMLPLVAFMLDFRRVDARAVSFVGLSLITASCIGSSLVTLDWEADQFFFWQGLQAIGQPLVVVPMLLMATNTVKGPGEAPFASALVNTPRALAEATGVWLIRLINRWRSGLHYNRLVDQMGQKRWRVLQGQQIFPWSPPALPSGGQSVRPGSLSAFGQGVEAQAQILTISDVYLILAAFTLALIVVLLTLPERTLLPRLQLAG